MERTELMELAKRMLAHVEMVDAVVRPGLAPALDEARREPARVRAVGVDVGPARTGAGVDMKKVQVHGLHG